MIAITGIGVISALGPGKQRLLEGLKGGASGIGRPSVFNVPGVSLLGEARDFDPKKFIAPLKARRMSRFSTLALASAIEAMEDAGLAIVTDNPFRRGVVVGTGLSSTESTDSFYGSLLEGGPLNQNPMVFPETVQNIAASHIAIHFGIKGPNTTFSQGEASSELALNYGVELLKDNIVDSVIVAGAEELSSAVIKGFLSLGAVSRKSGMMPFDIKRDGFVPSEGSAALVLERLEDAQRRNAIIYAIIASISFSSEPLERLTYDSAGGSMACAMESALEKSGVGIPSMVSASANSSPGLDGAEAGAIGRVLGAGAPVTAIRSYTGFFISDGMLRLAAAALSMKEGLIPKILGLTEPAADSIDLVVGAPRRGDIKSALINSFAGGGSASSVVVINPRIS